MKKLLLCLSAVFLLSCDMSINSEMYLADIVNYMNGKIEDKQIFFNCKIDLEILSEDDYNENPDKYISMLEGAFYKADNPAVFKKDFNTYLSATGRIYLASVKNDKENSNKSLIYFTADGNDESINIYLNFEENKMYRLNSAVKENTYQDMKIENISITISLQNDMPGEQIVTVYSSYVNNRPVLYNESFKLSRRDTLQIDLSEILKKYTYVNGSERIITIARQKTKKEPVKEKITGND